MYIYPHSEKTAKITGSGVKEAYNESSDHGVVKSAKCMLQIDLETAQKAGNAVTDKYNESKDHGWINSANCINIST
jgi:hypothetical protein